VGTVPTTSNATAVFIDGLVNALTIGGEDLAKSYLATTPMAWLEWPVISVFTNAALSALGSSIDRYSSQLVAAAVIDVQTNLEKSAVGNAVTALTAAQAGGNPDEITTANASFDAALGALVHWDGSAPPS
jgi:hypothetical protein